MCTFGKPYKMPGLELDGASRSYKLFKFLVSILNPLLFNPFMISDTFFFFDDLRFLNVDSEKLVMASLDIKSLFTNVILDETIDIINN